MSRGDDLLFAFDAAGPGDDAQVPAAHGEAAGLHDRRLRLRFAAGDFVRREDLEHFVDARAAFDAAHHGHLPLVADHGDHGPLRAAEHGRLQVRRFDFFNHVLNVLFFGITPHDDDHWLSSVEGLSCHCCDVVQSVGLGRLSDLVRRMSFDVYANKKTPENQLLGLGGRIVCS